MSTGRVLTTTQNHIVDERVVAKGDSRDADAAPRELEWLARWLDSAFRLPGGFRIGLDPILGLVPGVGDVTTSLASLYILTAAHRCRVPKITLTRMALNIVLETVVGAIPLVGDAFDVYWKSNQRNVELLRLHLAAPTSSGSVLRRSDRWFVVGVIAGLIALMIGAAMAAYWILSWVVVGLYRAMG